MNLRQSWGLLVGFVVGGAIACSGIRVSAQSRITPDNTLGAESSTVIPNLGGLPVEAIAGGAIRGGNLFHSFLEFNVSAGRGAYFYSPNAGIQNILARVTGSNSSQILGTLGTFGNSNPNLFLVNPNGITFGANASLNVGGSFVAATANAVQLGDKGLFSASEPVTSNLLSINPSAFFFNSLSHGAIANSSRATSTVLNTQTFGLQVPDGQSLLLVGGNINLNGGYLATLGGRIELGGLAGTGTVGLSVNGNNLSLSFPNNVARSDVVLTNGAVVDVTGNKGSIAVTTRNLNVLGGSVLQAGIGVGGTADSKAGNIEVDAQGAVNLKDGSLIFNIVRSGAAGKSGDVRITTGSLSLTNGAEVAASTFGRGDAGNVTITARDAVSLDGVSSNGFSSGAFSTVNNGAAGKGGNVEINTGSLSLTNGAQVAASTFGRGDAGNVTITARDAVSFDGVSSNGFSSGAFSTVNNGAVGKGGNVEINTGSLSLTNGSVMGTVTFGRGDAGNVTITAHNTVSFDGVGSNGASSGAFSTVNNGAVGKGGNVEINTGSLSLTNGAVVNAGTNGQGDAGNVTITAHDTVSFDGVGSNGFSSAVGSTVDNGAVGKGGNVEINSGSLSLTNGAQVAASTFGRGDAGNVTITAHDTVSFDGVGSNGFSSGAFSTVNNGAVGQGGNVEINSGSLSLTNGAEVAASTNGRGDAGNVTITARGAVSFDGTDSNGQSSGAGSTVNNGAVGQGGNVEINSGSLSLTNGAEVAASTNGRGDAGNVTITAHDTVSFDGTDNNGFPSGAFSTVMQGAAGKGGDVNITADSLAITHGASVNVTSSGQGIAGNVEVKARSVLLDNGTIEATTAASNGGNITLQIGDLLLLRHGSLISTSAGTAQAGGDGGNITINAPLIVAVPKEDSDIRANAYTGAGGNVNITTQGLFGIQFRPQDTPLSDITASSQFGVNGTVQINTPGVDPSRGLTDLAIAPVDTSKQIAQNCPARGHRQGSSFIITGNGGLPPRPEDPFTSTYPTGTVRGIPSSAASDPLTGSASSADISNPDRPPATPTIEEAQGWVYGPHGEVILTATAPTLTPQNAGVKPATCPQL